MTASKGAQKATREADRLMASLRTTHTEEEKGGILDEVSLYRAESMSFASIATLVQGEYNVALQSCASIDQRRRLKEPRVITLDPVYIWNSPASERAL